MWRSASLRTRLAVGVLLLTAFGLLLAATAGTLLLHSYLIGQVDQQLSGEVHRFADGRLPQAPTTTPVPGSNPGRRPPSLGSPYTVTRLAADGTVVQQVRDSQTSLAAPDLSGLGLATIRSMGSQPFDVGGVGDSSVHYRAVAASLPDGSGSLVVAVSTAALDETVRRAALAALAVGALTLGLVGLLSGIVIRVGLRPLEEVEATAERIAAGDLSQRVPDMPPGTEIGRLAASLNGMLGQIESAFHERTASEERLRRFVADASHELRTPLTTIRGYAELSRNGAISGEDERRTAIARIEAEAVRMGVLVDDLLLLARLDQQRPLERRPVDVAELVEAAAVALRAAAPDREVTVSAPAELVVEGDATRLRQVIDNLLANARVHTAEGTAIWLSAVQDDGTAVITVTDQGPGMAAEDLAHATERFYRGDSSRTRRRGSGSGLGLAIAEAIVEAHAGVLSIDSAPDRGTRITLRLPCAVAADRAPPAASAH